MRLHRAAGAKNFGQDSSEFTGQGKVVEFAVGPSTAYATTMILLSACTTMRCLPRSISEVVQRCHYPNAWSRLPSALKRARRKAALWSSQRPRLAIRLKGDCKQIITDRVNLTNYLAAVPKVESRRPFDYSVQSRMEVWINPTCPIQRFFHRTAALCQRRIFGCAKSVLATPPLPNLESDRRPPPLPGERKQDAAMIIAAIKNKTACRPAWQ